MTLILGCVTRDLAIQVADRRLALSDGRILDDDANKMTLFDGRVAFSYTGLAGLEGLRTDLWLANVLQRPDCTSLDKALDVLRTAATDAVRRLTLPASLTRIAFVGIGWSIRAPDNQTIPLVCHVSNFHDENGTVLSHALADFRLGVYFPRLNEPFVVTAFGQPPPTNVALKCRWLLRHHVKRQSSPRKLLDILVATVRDAAKMNKAVGKGLLSAVIPRVSVSRRLPFVLTEDGSTGNEVVSFRTWSGADDYNAVYRPHFAGPRPVLSNYSAGTLGSGGISFGDGTFTISYPCFYFTNEARTVLLTSNSDGKKYLTVFTERDAADAKDVVSGVKVVRLQIESPEGFARLLNAVRRDFDGVCFNPGIEGKCRLVPTDRLLGALGSD
jgi:hypothetical protein